MNKLKIIAILLTILLLTGCKPSTSELKEINDKIITYFSSEQREYDNLSFNYVDEKEDKVIVGLKNNTKEEQEKFKELVIDSSHIQFVEGKNNSNVPEIVTIEELKELQEQITDKISNKKDSTNFAACQVDEEERKVIVTLIKNTEEEQKWFKENIVNSPYITFIEEGPFTTFDTSCLENILGGYITTEILIPEEKSLEEFIAFDKSKVKNSKVKITKNLGIYVIIETEDEEVLKKLDSYFKEKYQGYQKTGIEKYTCYVYNGHNDFNLKEDLKVCE